MKNPPSLKFTSFTEQEKVYARNNDKLLFISLMTDPVCNLGCPDCYVDKNSDKLRTSAGRKRLSTAERIDVLDQAYELGARTLRIAGEGEPLLDKSFWPLVDHCSEKGMGVFFFTNGTLIDEAIADKISSSENLTPVLKFSGSPYFMEKFTGNRGYFTPDKFVEQDNMPIPIYLNNLIKRGLNTVENNETGLGVEILLRKANYGYISDIFRWARRNEIVPYVEQNLEAGRALEWEEYRFERVLDNDAFQLSKMLAAIDEREFGFSWIPSLPYMVGGICESEQTGCKKFTYNIVVASDGEVNPCYATYFKLGNVKEQPLEEILSHPIRRQLMQEPKYNCLCRVYNRTEKPISSIKDLDCTRDYHFGD